MKKFIANIVLAGLFMNFSYSEVLNQYQKWRFKDSLMAEIKDMNVNDFVSPSSEYVNLILQEPLNNTSNSSQETTSEFDNKEKYKQEIISIPAMRSGQNDILVKLRHEIENVEIESIQENIVQESSDLEQNSK